MGQDAETRSAAVSRYAVLYRERPAWLVPDEREDREGSGLPYPGDYAGVVIAARPEGHEWRPGDLADSRRKVVTLELTPDEVRRLRSRDPSAEGYPPAGGKLKIAGGKPPAGGKPAEVSFDDRWGAIAPALRARFVDAELAEENARRHLGLTAPGRGLDHSAEGEGEGEGEDFGRLAASLMRALPKVLVHSGAGLYEVGPGKPYSTIQSALDQLWSDQGSAEFTATQYIRVFAGTYTEDLVPNAGLTPDWDHGKLLILEGDPADDRDNIILQANAGLALDVSCDQIWLRHMKVLGTGASRCFYARSTCMSGRVSDCRIEGGGAYELYFYHGGLVEDSVIVHSSGDVAIFGVRGIQVRRTLIILSNANGKAVMANVSVTLDSVVVDGGLYALGYTAWYEKWRPLLIRNCTFYNVTNGVRFIGGDVVQAQVVDTIFKDVDYPYFTAVAGEWPQEAGGHVGPEFVQRNNCYHGYTAYAYDGTTTKTAAEWAAFNQVDASGELDQTDPKLTNPAGGDFSLAADSPCRHAGRGSGVVAGYLGTAFDPSFPDMGAWSSDGIDPPARPSAEIVAVAGYTITVGIEGDDGDEGVEHTAELVRASTGEVVDLGIREGDGDVSLTAPELAARYFVVVSSTNAAGRSLPTTPCEVTVSEGPGPEEEVRIAVVSRLKAHAGLAALLGTDETGAVPVYAAGPAKPRRLPCLVYMLGGRPDEKLSRRGRWIITLAFEAWGGSPGVNDGIVGFLDEILDRQPFQTTSWAVKRSHRGEDETRWADDGRTEIRRLSWTFVVDHVG